MSLRLDAVSDVDSVAQHLHKVAEERLGDLATVAVRVLKCRRVDGDEPLLDGLKDRLDGRETPVGCTMHAMVNARCVYVVAIHCSVSA